MGLFTARSGRIALIAGFGLAAVLAGGAAWLARNFPFRREAVEQQIAKRTGGRVAIGAFHERWFPPGFSAERLRISDPAGDLLTIDAVAMERGVTGLHLQARGSRLQIVPAVTGKPRTLLRPGADGSNGSLSLDEIRLDDTRIDFVSRTLGKPPLEFALHRLLLRNADPSKQTGFEVSLTNPKPHGEIHARGTFGPLDTRVPGRTPVSGTFTFTNVDLTVDGAVSGLLNASGEFHGPVNSLNSSGTADAPRFQVSGSTHPVHIAARFAALVNALNGDTELQSIEAHYNRTTVLAAGRVMAKTVTLDTNVKDGRIDDILLLFTNQRLPAVRGPLRLRARFIIPPGPPGFLTKLKADGEFAISDARFTNPGAQTPVDRLSASAEGVSKKREREDPTLATAAIRGKFTAHDGVAHLPSVAFDVPGVTGELAGTFGLRDKAIDMRGSFDTAGKLADTTSGVKAFLLKAAGPLWRKKASVKTVPFRVTGKAPDPIFRLTLR